MKLFASIVLILSLAFLAPVPLYAATPMPHAKIAAGDCHEHQHAPAKATAPMADHACCPSVTAISPVVLSALYAPDKQRMNIPAPTVHSHDSLPRGVFHPPRA